jgi:hypothetical protein
MAERPAEAVAILRQSTGDGALAAAACDRVYWLAQNRLVLRFSRLRKDELGAAGAVQAVVVALNAHRGDEYVQGAGCRALGSLVNDHEGNQAAAEAAGAVRAVVDALHAHHTSKAVQANGCEALVALAKDHAGNAAAAVAAHTGGVDVVAAALQMLPAHLSGNARAALAVLAPGHALLR